MRNTSTRNPSGRPETAADSRFHDARESGYRGAIDQDGRKVDDVDSWIATQSGNGAQPNR